MIVRRMFYEHLIIIDDGTFCGDYDSFVYHVWTFKSPEYHHGFYLTNGLNGLLDLSLPPKHPVFPDGDR